MCHAPACVSCLFSHVDQFGGGGKTDRVDGLVKCDRLGQDDDGNVVVASHRFIRPDSSVHSNCLIVRTVPLVVNANLDYQ